MALRRDGRLHIVRTVFERRLHRIPPMPPKLPPDYLPSNNEPFMNSVMREHFRRRLVRWREDILNETSEALQSLQEEETHETDVADRASIEADRSVRLRTRDRARKLVAKIDAALDRIEGGTYGYCEETSEPISIQRLEARPIATLSVEAQERHERLERTHRGH